jgi:acetyl-CoA C-acetyltransferase/acetyl-CoA acyltransferase
MRDQLVIVDGIRTPFCRAGTDLADLGADELGRAAVRALLARTGLDPGAVDHVLFGCVAQPLEAGNLARVIALRSGIPAKTPAVTLHRNCASGFESLTQADLLLNAGRGEVFIVGGVESMSRIPLLVPRKTASKFRGFSKARSLREKFAACREFRGSDFRPEPGLRLVLSDPDRGMSMGQTAELIGREAGVTREQQDEFAHLSHQKAVSARARHAQEMTPLYVPPDFARVVSADNGPRPDSSPTSLAALRPVFEERTGTVTAGNSSQITDGAVALLAMSSKRAAREGLEPLGALADYAYAGCDPARMGLGPLYAMARMDRAIDQADLIEINEAFAAQVLACVERARSAGFARSELGRDRPLGEMPRERLNVNGGAIALGHPVGASGARLVLTALKELRRRNGRRALVSACVGGGQGAALWLERS